MIFTKVYIKRFRKLKKMTLLTLADAVGISENYLSEIENGKHIPSLEVSCKLAKVLGVLVTDIFDCQSNNENEED